MLLLFRLPASKVINKAHCAYFANAKMTNILRLFEQFPTWPPPGTAALGFCLSVGVFVFMYFPLQCRRIVSCLFMLSGSVVCEGLVLL